MVWAIRSRRSIPISHLSSVGSAPWWRLRKSLKGISESDHARTRIKGSVGFEARGPTLLLLREMAPRSVGVARAPDIRSRSSDLAVSKASYRSHPDVRCIRVTDLMEPPSETEFSNPRQDGIVGAPQTLRTMGDVLRCGAQTRETPQCRFGNRNRFPDSMSIARTRPPLQDAEWQLGWSVFSETTFS